MSAPALEPGMLVECVDASDRNDLTPWHIAPEYEERGLEGLVAGHVYTVRRVGAFAQARHCVWLEEIERRPVPHFGEPGYHISRFRPLSGDRLAIFRQHLTGIPSKTKETA
jgi:hypothetical protein